jgi:HEAT repeat protein
VRDAEFKAALLASAKTLLDTPTPSKRALAVAELARSRSPEALKLLDGVWRDPAREVRKAAAQTFYKFGDKPAVQEAYRALSTDDDDYIRVISALRWSRLGSVEADSLLVGLLESDVQWDRERAVQELAKRTGDRFAFDPTSDPKSQNNQNALGRWRSWIDARMNPTTPSVSGESSHR